MPLVSLSSPSAAVMGLGASYWGDTPCGLLKRLLWPLRASYECPLLFWYKNVTGYTFKSKLKFPPLTFKIVWFASILSLNTGGVFYSRALLGIIDALWAVLGVISVYHDALMRLAVCAKCRAFAFSLIGHSSSTMDNTHSGHTQATHRTLIGHSQDTHIYIQQHTHRTHGSTGRVTSPLWRDCSKCSQNTLFITY